MEATWIGQSVSIYCEGKLGVFQGSIKDASSSQITITRAFRNGVPLRKQDAEITLSVADIKKIELLPTYNTPSTVIPTVINKPTPVKQPNFGAVKKQQESTLSNKISIMKITNGQRNTPPFENKKLPPTNNYNNHNNSSVLNNHSKSSSPPSSSVAKFFGNMIPSKVEVKMGVSLGNNQQNHHSIENGRNTTKPIDILSKSAGQPNNTPMKQNHQQQQQQLQTSDKKNKTQARRDRDARQNVNNQTFGTPIDDPIMGEEFDFEGNLALFDKQAIWDTIEARQKPDLVRQAVSSQRNKKYRHDENVLASEPIQFRQIELYSQDSTDFVTDEGLIIPTIPLSIRSKIQQIADKNGLLWSRQCDILARGVTDLAILLLGGARRLTPNNRHQWPKITIISDKSQDDKVSEIAAATGRHLASHGLKVCLYVKENSKRDIIEFDLFRATGNNIVNSITELPSSDLVILSISSNTLSSSVKRWLVENRSAILAIDPPPNGITDVPIKCSILPILPLNNISLACGKLYLCNIGIPDKFYRESGILKYKSPFGHKFVIPIHMND